MATADQDRLPKSPRPEYSTPRLARLGNLARLTRAIGHASSKDGGQGQTNRSQA